MNVRYLLPCDAVADTGPGFTISTGSETSRTKSSANTAAAALSGSIFVLSAANGATPLAERSSHFVTMFGLHLDLELGGDAVGVG